MQLQPFRKHCAEHCNKTATWIVLIPQLDSQTMCDMTHFMCDMPHSYVWNDSCICVTCFIHMCDMTLTCLMHIYVWHDSCICVAWIALTPKLVSQTRGGRERDSEREGRNMTRRKGERERRGGEERRNGRRDCTRKCERKWRREREREKEQREGVRRGEEGGETARASETERERESVCVRAC